MTFKEISMGNREEMKKYLRQSGNRGCNFCVGNILTWGESLSIEYTIAEEILVFRRVEGEQVLYHVSGQNENFSELVESLFSDAKELGKEMALCDLSREMTEVLREAYPGIFKVEYDRDGSDYVYETASLANLSGKRYHKKKNHVNRFCKKHDFSYEEISPENKEECLKMAQLWLSDREMDESLEAERAAIENAFRYYEILGFEGGFLRVDGQVMAFTLGERAADDTFVTHFEKALDTYPELYAVINQQFAKNHLEKRYRYVNREEDLGLSGLRKAKLSYHPVFMVDKYRAVPKARFGRMDICLCSREDQCRSA